MQRKKRIYVDTSVLGGCLDEEFRIPSRMLVEQIAGGRFILLASDLMLAEAAGAPEEVRRMLGSIPAECIERARVTEEAARLRDEYLRAGIVGESASDDALHVAIASVEKADFIVSWNFRHIVRSDRARRYNGINVAYGYEPVSIVAPWEVLHDE